MALTNFTANLVIVNPNLIAKKLMSDLPDNYTRSQNSNLFAFNYGSGYSFEALRQALAQMEANNYIFNPDTQRQALKIDGAGKYIAQFDIPFVVPPINVSVTGSDYTDVFIEYTDRFSMVINVQTDIADVLTWTATGWVGAAYDSNFGDALYNNFGALFDFPRLGDCQPDESHVKQYENANLFLTVSQITAIQKDPGVGPQTSIPPPLYNAPPVGLNYYTGIIRPTSVLSTPPATHELIDNNGNLIALLDTTTINTPLSAFYASSGFNMWKVKKGVYVVGTPGTFVFDRWKQPLYEQEIFRADNKYRRILSGINRALQEGPSVKGVANITETLLAQPYIPYDIWTQSDFRLFKATSGQTTPKFAGATQYQTYPVANPTVEVKRVMTTWSPDTITYNNQPATVSIDQPVTQTVTNLNAATRFNISDELFRQLRLGLDLPQGGVIDWNYTNVSVPASGFYMYEGTSAAPFNTPFNYAFLNNQNDSYGGLNLFYYAVNVVNGNATGYTSHGPLIFNQDYFLFNTSTFYNPPDLTYLNGSYALPSDLLKDYQVDSNIPFNIPIGNQIYHLGSTNPNLLPIPQFVLRFKLNRFTTSQTTITQSVSGTSFPANNNDFLIYSYVPVNVLPSTIEGQFRVDVAQPDIISFFDANLAQAVQPSDSPFVNLGGNYKVTALAQNSFANFTNTANATTTTPASSVYEYAITMLGGQIEFNKSIVLDNVLQSATALNDATASTPLFFVMNALQCYADNDSIYQSVTSTQFTLHGTLKSMISNNKRRVQLSYGNYCIVDSNDHLLAILTDDSRAVGGFAGLVGQQVRVLGIVYNTIWDTRIPVTNYLVNSPIFQASSNFDSVLTPFTPDQTLNIATDNNFLVIIDGLPVGIQLSITATWGFNIATTNQIPQTIDVSALNLASVKLPNNTVQDGILSLFTGRTTTVLRGVQGIFQDIDVATYNQTYTSPLFNGYFLNYKDYLNSMGSFLTPNGDANLIDTLTHPANKSGDGTISAQTSLNFFSPAYGFISLTILPTMNFTKSSGASVVVTRPNNNGFALQIQGDSRAGLVFYGTNTNTVVDKPTRMLIDFSYTLANAQNRKKVIEIEDGGFANWVNADKPNDIMTGSTFFLTGNEFKYAHFGYDQAPNQFNDTYNISATGYPEIDSYGNLTYAENPNQVSVSGPFYSVTPSSFSPYPIFEVDPSLPANVVATHGINNYGPPMRYRRPAPRLMSAQSGQLVPTNYTNTGAEKIAYLQFDLSSFPRDTVVGEAFLEVYFASGFTVVEGKNINLTMNDNKAWSHSRLSGNGGTFVYTTETYPATSYIKPLNNVHWRGNFCEILVPYAFMSEPLDINYGIRNIFNSASFSLPAPTNPQANLEYLGFINIDEIDVTLLTDQNNLIENSVGLANIILTQNSIIYTVAGVLTFNLGASGLGVVQDTSLLNGNLVTGIAQTLIVPNQKVLLFPLGLNSDVFIYGYVKSILPSSYIGFTPTDIAMYQRAINYVMPIYAQYCVKLLEADTYFTYTSWGRDSEISGTTKDISI